MQPRFRPAGKRGRPLEEVARCADCHATWKTYPAQAAMTRDGRCLACGGPLEGVAWARVRELRAHGQSFATAVRLLLTDVESDAGTRVTHGAQLILLDVLRRWERDQGEAESSPPLNAAEP